MNQINNHVIHWNAHWIKKKVNRLFTASYYERSIIIVDVSLGLNPNWVPKLKKHSNEVPSKKLNILIESQEKKTDHNNWVPGEKTDYDNYWVLLIGVSYNYSNKTTFSFLFISLLQYTVKPHITDTSK